MIRINPVRVSAKVFDGIEAVRLSGETSMFDAPMVQRIAFEMEYFETVLWMEDHLDIYGLGIFVGFEVDGGKD